MAIPTTGLIAAWNLTGYSSVQQSVAGAHGTSEALQAGSTSGADGDDPASTATNGFTMNSSGADDYCQATTLADTDMLGDITVIFAGRMNQSSSGIASKANSDTASAPFHFKCASDRLEFARAHTTGYRSHYGPVVDSGNFQMYAVTAATAMETAPTFWVNKHSVTGTALAGAGTGASTTSSSTLRIGTIPNAGANLTASYFLIYSRILTDAEIKGIYDDLEAVMVGVSETLAGFMTHRMTSASAPSPFAASGSTGTGYLAFEGGLGTGSYWTGTNGGVDWLKADIGSGKTRTLGTYKVYAHNQYAPGTEGPKDWTMEGSNDDSSWSTLDTVTGETGWGSGEIRTFTCDTATTAYRYFRLNITANGAGSGNTTVGELYFHESIPAESSAAIGFYYAQTQGLR